MLAGTGAEAEEPVDDLFEPVPMWPTEYPEASELMAAVIEAIPGNPMQIQATIHTKRQGVGAEHTIYAEVLMHSRAGLYSAMYTLRDAFGGGLEQLTISRAPEQTPIYHYRKGDPPQEAHLPDLSGRVKETNLSWIDLSLSYLWWPDGETVATDRIRGRFCYVIELPAPMEHEGEFSAVRVWIDPKINMLLMAEAYDHDRERIRRLTVESFKKVDGVWFIKDIDVVSYPSRDRSRLRVDSIRAVAEAVEPPAVLPLP
jgi:hypothetical protein